MDVSQPPCDLDLWVNHLLILYQLAGLVRGVKHLEF